jgi:hypothetical protein
MAESAITTSLPQAPPAPAGAPSAAAPRPAVRPRGVWDVIKLVLAPVASLRLTVVLFALSIVLVFCGTLAQIDAGIFTVVNTYFRTAVVWIPFQIFFPRRILVPGGFPYPGGWLLGGLLLANLLAAHVVRFKLTWRRSGILLIHSGLVVMMLSELITGLFAIEGKMTILVGRSLNFLEQHDAKELAIITSLDGKTDDVVVVPAGLLRRGGTIRNEMLPFDIQVVRYMTNSSRPDKATGGMSNPADAGDGKVAMVQERPETRGVDPEQEEDAPSAYLTFRDKASGDSLGTYLVTWWWSDRLSLWGEERPQHVTVDGKSYQVFLRSKRLYKPYTIHLNKFTHKVFEGTSTPRDFASDIRLVDPSENEDREVRIWMNNPLRYGGETFYQSGFIPGDLGTILQVVHNPGWLLPYIACAMVSGGMLVHFGLTLLGFLRRRAAS